MRMPAAEIELVAPERAGTTGRVARRRLRLLPRRPYPDPRRQIMRAALSSEIIPPGAPWSAIMRRGQTLRIIDTEGEQGVDFLCYSASNPEERYHAANTLQRGGTLLITSGHVLYSDVARPMMGVVGDSCLYHDTVAG